MDNLKFKNNVLKIIEELDKYFKISKTTIYDDSIKAKLDYSVLNYNKELALNSRFIEDKSNKKVLKTLSRLQKDQDREVLKNSISKNKKD